MNVFGKGVAYALEQYLNNAMREFGHVERVEVEAPDKRVSALLFLKGESNPVSLVVNDYDFISDGENSHVVIRKLDTSKEWINIVFKKYLGELKIQIPKQAATVAKMVM